MTYVTHGHPVPFDTWRSLMRPHFPNFQQRSHQRATDPQDTCVLIPVTAGDPSQNDSEFLKFFFCSSDVNEKPYAVSYSDLA